MHENLALLGRTPLGPEEQSFFLEPIPVLPSPIPNSVFLYEIRQLDHFQENQSPDDDLPPFWTDLSNYLGLSEPLQPTRYTGSTRDRPVAFNVCDPAYKAIRGVLTDIGDQSATWIRNYFLDADNVFVSDRPYFESLLETWKMDPCAAENGEA